MEQIISFATIISILTIGIVQGIKQTGSIPKNIVPLISIVIGGVIGGVSLFIPEIFSELSIGARILGGIISGLMATGLWETGKKRSGNTKQDHQKQGGGNVK
ncbi:holin [Staphylococcus nepalensis]|uniref:holin n=1 Tax=Staphylococcus nepalensis TaxID=214473 RepID=UPI0031BAF449